MASYAPLIAFSFSSAPLAVIMTTGSSAVASFARSRRHTS
jgi:hypothetical protein